MAMLYIIILIFFPLLFLLFISPCRYFIPLNTTYTISLFISLSRYLGFRSLERYISPCRYFFSLFLLFCIILLILPDTIAVSLYWYYPCPRHLYTAPVLSSGDCIILLSFLFFLHGWLFFFPGVIRFPRVRWRLPLFSTDIFLAFFFLFHPVPHFPFSFLFFSFFLPIWVGLAEGDGGKKHPRNIVNYITY